MILCDIMHSYDTTVIMNKTSEGFSRLQWAVFVAHLVDAYNKIKPFALV